MNRSNMMKRRNQIAAALLGAGFALALAAPASAQPGWDHGPREMTPEMQQRMQTRQQQRLDRMAQRLEIKPSQQEAWQAYAKARQELFAARPAAPARDADAATLARYRADRAAEMAQRLAALADATAKLQGVLEPAQAKTLAELTRRPVGDGDGWGKRHGGRGHRDGAGGWR